jgi:hypothetical protein
MNLKKPSYALGLAIFLLSLLLRLSLISKGPFNLDTLNLIIQSQDTLKTFKLHYLFGTGYPMVVLIGAVFIAFLKMVGLNDPTLAINMSSVISSSLCVLLFYHILRVLISEAAALFGSIILAVCPTFLDISIYGMSHAPALFFLFLTIWAILKFKESLAQKNIWIAGISLGLSAACRIQDAFLLLPALCWLYWMPIKSSWPAINIKDKFINLIKMLSSFAVVTIFFYGLIIMTDRENYLTQLHSYLTLESNQPRHNWRESLEISLFFLKSNFTIAGLILFALGLYTLLYKQWRLGLFVLLWTIFPLLFFGQLLSTASRYFTIFIPAMIMAQSYFLAKLSKINTFFFFMISIIFLLVVFVPLVGPYKMFKVRHDHAYIPEYAKWIAKKTPPDALIITGDEGLFIDYYSRRKSMRKPSSLSLTNKELNEFKVILDEPLNNKTPVYITCLGLDSYDWQGRFRSFMLEHYRLFDVGSRPYEGWHTSPYMNSVLECPLIKIEKKD